MDASGWWADFQEEDVRRLRDYKLPCSLLKRGGQHQCPLGGACSYMWVCHPDEYTASQVQLFKSRLGPVMRAHVINQTRGEGSPPRSFAAHDAATRSPALRDRPASDWADEARVQNWYLAVPCRLYRGRWADTCSNGQECEYEFTIPGTADLSDLRKTAQLIVRGIGDHRVVALVQAREAGAAAAAARALQASPRFNLYSFLRDELGVPVGKERLFLKAVGFFGDGFMWFPTGRREGAVGQVAFQNWKPEDIAFLRETLGKLGFDCSEYEVRKRVGGLVRNHMTGCCFVLKNVGKGKLVNKFFTDNYGYKYEKSAAYEAPGSRASAGAGSSSGTDLPPGTVFEEDEEGNIVGVSSSASGSAPAAGEMGSPRDHESTCYGSAVPNLGMTSAKWFLWLFWLLEAIPAWELSEGYHRADGNWALRGYLKSGEVVRRAELYTSCARFKEELIVMLLHAGCPAVYTLGMIAGGMNTSGVISRHNAWRVRYSLLNVLRSSRATEPAVESGDVERVTYVDPRGVCRSPPSWSSFEGRRWAQMAW